MIKVEIEVYTSEVTPEEGRDICMYVGGRWEMGVFTHGCFCGKTYGRYNYHTICDPPDHVELWYYLPERDIFE